MKKFGYILIVFQIVTTLGLFMLSKSDISILTMSPYLTLSQVSSLVGTILLSDSFILSSRFIWIEALFGGLDKVYKAHAITSAVSYLLLLHHLILLVVSRLPSISATLPLVIPGRDMSITWGIFSLLTFTLLIFITLYIDLPYHVWKSTHEWMGLGLLFGSLHVIFIKSDIARFWPLRLWILVSLSFAATSYIYKRFLYRLLGPTFTYILKDIRRVGDVHELTLIPKNHKLFFIPGQFIFLNHRGGKISREEHPFSIVSTPYQDELTIAAKISGDYTLTLDRISQGDEFGLSGPYGSFGERFLSKKPAVFIAGGIGITPFVSMITSALNRSMKQPIHLFYVAKTTDEAIYHQHFVRLAAILSNLTYVAHQSRFSGRLTASVITAMVTQIKQANIFLCGPAQMMESLTHQLTSLGVRRRNIIYEDFRFK